MATKNPVNPDRSYHTSFTKRLIACFFLLLLLAVAGFYASYFQYFPFIKKHMSFLVHFHALFMMAWLILLILQPLLVVTGKREVHKKIGKFTWILASLIVISTVLLIIERYKIDASRNVPLISNVATRLISVFTITSFIIFYSLALKYKNNKSVHLRYIIGTGLTFVPASATRLFYFMKINPAIAEFSTLLLINGIIVALIIRDKILKVNLKEKPYNVILIFQLFLTGYYGLLFIIRSAFI